MALYSCHDLLRSQLIVLCQQLIVVSVVKTLLDTEAERLHVAVAIEASDLLAESTFERAILQGNHLLVVCFQAFEHLLVKTRDVTRVDERSVDAFLFLQ